MNETYITGIIQKNIKKGNGEFGDYAFFTLKTSKKVGEKWYDQYINCLANKGNVSKIEEGNKVFIKGSLKGGIKEGKYFMRLDVSTIEVYGKIESKVVNSDELTTPDDLPF